MENYNGNYMNTMMETTMTTLMENYNEHFNEILYANFDEDYYENNIKREEVEVLLMSVPGIKAYKVQIFLDYFFIEGASQRFVGEKNGVTGQNISLIISNIIKIIKKNKRLFDRMSELLK